MKVVIKQDRLAKALSAASRVAASMKAGLPILSNVMLRADKKQLSLTSTNMELATVEYISAKIEESGMITVPARLFSEFVSNLPKGDIELSSKNEKLTVSSNKYQSIINGILADDFPELPKIDEKKAVIFKIDVETFKEAIGEVIVASSNDTTRPALTGVYFNTYNKALFIAATDGYRLTDRKFVEKVESEVKAIVPTSALQEVLRQITDDVDEIEVLIDDSQVKFRMGEVEITSKLIDASFPDYRQLIPKESDEEIVLDRSELVRMTKVAALFARESGGSVSCEAKADEGIFIVKAIASELGENSSAIDAEIKKDKKVVLNSRYLLDALNVLSEEKLDFGMSGKLAPVVIRNNKNKDYTHIIMPLKS